MTVWNLLSKFKTDAIYEAHISVGGNVDKTVYRILQSYRAVESPAG